MLSQLNIDTAMNHLQSYEEILMNSDPQKSEGVFQKTIDEFEDDLLNYSALPEEHFRFVLKLLSDKRFYSRPGLWNLLAALGTESHKLESCHYQGIANALLSHYVDYFNDDLCLSVCDFVARNYPFDTAQSILDSLENLEMRKPLELRGFAKDGRRIMHAEAMRRSKMD